jgi:hypothetical protein
MGILGRQETERRLKIMAKTMVDMERGVYQWPDGRKPLRPNGDPVISKAECARAAGYSGVSNARNMAVWFEDPYYLRELEKERARREFNMEKLVENEENLPLALAKGLFIELLIRMQHDPGSITTTQILNFAPSLHKYGLELAALQDAFDATPQIEGKLDDFNGKLTSNVYDMNQTERTRLLASTQDAQNVRMDAVRAAVAKVNVIEESADAGRDSGEPLTADGTAPS